MTELLKPFVSGNEDFIQNREDLQILIACLIQDWPEGILSISPCGIFPENFIEEYESYLQGTYSESGISSPGFGYSAPTIKAMEERGFYSGPSVALMFRGFEYSLKPIVQTQEIDRHIGQRYKDEFDALGIKTFWAAGGDFPGETNSTAIILDITDPQLLQKLKPVFLQRFPQRKARSLLDPLPHLVATEELRYAYAYEVLKVLAETAFEGVSAEDSIQALQAARELSPEATAKIKGQVDYKMRFLLPALRAMRSVLSAKEKENIIKETAGLIMGQKTAQSHPAVELGLIY
jgi:hypothetical protein